jgi:tryptophan-rich sensory protein
MDWWALSVAAGLCVTMIVAEAALTGSELQRWLASLKHPRYYLPLWVWMIAAVATYALQGVIAYRLLRMGLTSVTVPALALLVALMVANIAYNVVLDRTHNPRLAYVGILWFVPLLGGLQAGLYFADEVSAALNLIYVAWVVGYDLPIMRALWRLNA